MRGVLVSEVSSGRSRRNFKEQSTSGEADSYSHLLTANQPLQQFKACWGTCRFVTLCTTECHRTLSKTTYMKARAIQLTSLMSIVLLSSRLSRTAIAQSVSLLPTGWTVRGSNTGGGRLSAPVHTGPRAHSTSCTVGTGYLSWRKAAGAWCWPPTRI